MVPRDGERFLLAGEPFKVEGFHEGVRIAWECNGLLDIDEFDGNRFYAANCLTEVVYHQRRNAFRAALKLTRLVNVELGGEKLKSPSTASCWISPPPVASCALTATSLADCNWARSTTA